MKKFRFKVDRLAGDVFYDPTRDVVGSALFLYGFPSFVGPNPAVLQLVESGYAVLSPHFYGTYDSDGDCSPATMLATVKDTIGLLATGRIVKCGSSSSPITLPPVTIAVGHSFGTAVLLRSAAYVPDADALLLLSPTAHYGREPVDYGMRSDGPTGYEATLISHPNTYRLAPLDEWMEIFAGADRPILQDTPQLKKVTMVFGAKDAYFDVPVAADAAPELVAGYLGHTPADVIVLGEAGHSLDELLLGGEFSIPQWLAR